MSGTWSDSTRCPELNVGVDAATPLVGAAMPSAGAAKPTSIGRLPASVRSFCAISSSSRSSLRSVRKDRERCATPSMTPPTVYGEHQRA